MTARPGPTAEHEEPDQPTDQAGPDDRAQFGDPERSGTGNPTRPARGAEPEAEDEQEQAVVRCRQADVTGAATKVSRRLATALATPITAVNTSVVRLASIRGPQPGVERQRDHRARRSDPAVAGRCATTAIGPAPSGWLRWAERGWSAWS